MRDKVVQPFETIESAHEFMVVLEGVIADVSSELQSMATSAATARYGTGVRLALFKVDQLSSHVAKSRRILNDLTLIRGVLVGDNSEK